LSALYDSVARIARHEAQQRIPAAVATVEAIFDGAGAPPDHAVTVRLRDSQQELPRVPIVTGALGFAATPAVGDLVVVVFLDGSLDAPVVVGRLHHADLAPPAHGADELVLALPPGAEEPTLRVTIDGAEPSMQAELPGEVKISAREDEVEIAVGKLTVHLRASDSTATIAAGGSTLTLTEDGDVKLAAKGKLQLEGQQVEISGQSKLVISGQEVSLN
jgi:uncharacterized protein involved in type VI secretion and phage assembly